MHPHVDYGPDNHLVDYILGITHQIWEGGGIDLILNYYDEQVEVYALDGVTVGAIAMLRDSQAFLAAFPDRLLIGDGVIWSRESNGDFYSSHRIFSPMTNLGDSIFAPATGKKVQIMNIADCLVCEGKIVKEWLVRDNLALVRQLGVDPVRAAETVGRNRDVHSREWVSKETERLENSIEGERNDEGDPAGIAGHLLNGLWQSSETALEDFIGARYAPYAVLHRSPIEYYSGSQSILGHYSRAREVFGKRRISLDHVAATGSDEFGTELAARWTMHCTHSSPFVGIPASGKSLLILGVSQWRLLEGRVLREWTVFDQLAVLGQVLD